MTDRYEKIRRALASIKTLARYEPDTVYIGTGEYVAECVRADDGDYYLAADVDAAIRALLAERDALLSAPPGWKLAPVEPTEAMKAAGCRALGAIYGHFGAEQCWKTMLAAAPEPGEGDSD